MATVLIILHGCSALENIPERSGVQLWAENCQRCHVAPPPSSYHDYRWETIGTHMRIRANLTGMEEKKILEFLQSANGKED